MHTFQTRRLGDSIHACAVMAAMARRGGNATLHVYAPFAGLFSGGPLRVLADARGTHWSAVSRGAFKGPEHGCHIRHSMARAAAVDDADLDMKLGVCASLVGNRPYIAICPDAGAPYKEWPRPRWAPLIEYIFSQGHEVIICGLPGRQKIPAPALAQHTSLAALPFASVLAGARAVVGPDSGHIHLADALGVPAVGLYAATSTTTYGPYGDKRWCIDRHREAFPSQVPYDSARHLIGNVMGLIELEEVTQVLAQFFRSQRGLP